MRTAVSPASCPTTTKLFLGFVTDRTETSSRITRGFPPVARSHTRSVESPPPLTTTGRPSSAPTATARTRPVWPVNGSPSGSPVARSYTRAVESAPRLTTTEWPSTSPTATDETPLGPRLRHRGLTGTHPGRLRTLRRATGLRRGDGGQNRVTAGHGEGPSALGWTSNMLSHNRITPCMMDDLTTTQSIDVGGPSGDMAKPARQAAHAQRSALW